MVIGILPETAGKLSHAWEGIAGACSRCGSMPTEPRATLADKRLRCQHRPLVMRGPTAVLTRALAVALLSVFADHPAVTELLPGRGPARLADRWAPQIEDPAVRAARWDRARSSSVLAGLVRTMARQLGDPGGHGLSVDATQAMEKGLISLLAALGNDALTAEAAREVYTTAARVDRGLYGKGSEQRTFARKLLLLLPPGSAAQAALAAELRALGANDERWGDGPWDGWEARVSQLAGHYRMHRDTYLYQHVAVVDDRLLVHQRPLGDPKHALDALLALKREVRLGYGPPCGEPLFQAVPRPRSTPLAAYLAKRHRGVVDLVIVDEAHQFTNQDSAAGQELAQFMGTRMLLLTGSLSNGYAVGLFAILWCISKPFRERFARDEIHDFGRMFGYLRRYVDMLDKDTREVVAFGKTSDRVERRRTIGYAPGILPSLLLTYVLPVAAVLRMKDLEVDLPPRSEVVEVIDPGPVLGPRVRALRAALMAQIREDRDSDLAGKLFGQMGEEWSSADRASEGIGNSPDGIYRVTYPEAVGGQTVAELAPMPAAEILPKERRLLEIVKGELTEDRPVLVFVWHSHCGLFERLARLIHAETGELPVILESEKVPAKKRQAWLKREVIAKRKRVLLCNPAAVETGLNCLTHFCTLVWFQPPDCDPRAKRQAEGRVYRLGQTRPVRIHWLLYTGTSQEVLHRLLLLKVAESEAVDGLDPTSALQAAGIGAPAGMTGFDLGRAIFEAVNAEEGGEPLSPAPGKRFSTNGATSTPEVAALAPLGPVPAQQELPAPAPLAISAPASASSAGALPAAGVVEQRVGRSQRVRQLGWAW
jgi:hypothetical protein